MSGNNVANGTIDNNTTYPLWLVSSTINSGHWNTAPDPRLLTSSRPPLVFDFLDPALTIDTPHKRIVKVVHAKVEPFSRVEVQQFEIAMPTG